MQAFGALFTRDGVAAHTVKLREKRAEAVVDAVQMLECEGQCTSGTRDAVAASGGHYAWQHDGQRWAAQVIVLEDKRPAVVGAAAIKKDEQPDLSGSSQAILERNGLDG